MVPCEAALAIAPANTSCTVFSEGGAGGLAWGTAAATAATMAAVG